MPNKTLEKWEEKTLGNICDLQNGFAFSSKDYIEYSNTLNIRMSNIRPNGNFDETHNIKYLPDNYAELYKDYILNDGDLIIAMTDMAGDPKILGVPTVIKHKNKNQIFLMNQRVGRLLNFSEDISIAFLKYLLISPSIQKVYKSKGKGGVQLNISKNDILSIKILIPNKIEQQRIVGILDEAFENIEKSKQNALQNLNNAKELFESYLTSILINKDNWDKKKLSDVAIDFGRGRSRHRPRNDKKLYGGQYPFIQTGDIRNSNHLITEYSQTYNEIGLAQSKLWPKGTLCITIAANIAETGVLTFDACFPDSVIGCVFDETKTNIDYVEYLLQSFKAILQAEGKGSAQDNINLGTFEKYYFPFPNKAKQDEIVDKLNCMRTNIAKLEQVYEQKIKDLDELKQSILQKAFNGEL